MWAIPELDPLLGQSWQPSPLQDEQLQQVCCEPFTPLHVPQAKLLWMRQTDITIKLQILQWLLFKASLIYFFFAIARQAISYKGGIPSSGLGISWNWLTAVQCVTFSLLGLSPWKGLPLQEWGELPVAQHVLPGTCRNTSDNHSRQQPSQQITCNIEISLELLQRSGIVCMNSIKQL